MTMPTDPKPDVSREAVEDFANSVVEGTGGHPQAKRVRETLLALLDAKEAAERENAALREQLREARIVEWNAALDAGELKLRRMYAHLWPHDVNAAKALEELRRG